MVLLDVLGLRWTLRILWELQSERLTFRELQARCGDISPTILNSRLKVLRELKILDHQTEGYGYTPSGSDLGAYLISLDEWANKWAVQLDAS